MKTPVKFLVGLCVLFCIFSESTVQGLHRSDPEIPGIISAIRSILSDGGSNQRSDFRSTELISNEIDFLNILEDISVKLKDPNVRSILDSLKIALEWLVTLVEQLLPCLNPHKNPVF